MIFSLFQAICVLAKNGFDAIIGSMAVKKQKDKQGSAAVNKKAYHNFEFVDVVPRAK